MRFEARKGKFLKVEEMRKMTVEKQNHYKEIRVENKKLSKMVKTNSTGDTQIYLKLGEGEVMVISKIHA